MRSILGYRTSDDTQYYVVLIGVWHHLSDDRKACYNIMVYRYPMCLLPSAPGHSLPLILNKLASGLFRYVRRVIGR